MDALHLLLVMVHVAQMLLLILEELELGLAMRVEDVMGSDRAAEGLVLEVEEVGLVVLIRGVLLLLKLQLLVLCGAMVSVVRIAMRMRLNELVVLLLVGIE